MADAIGDKLKPKVIYVTKGSDRRFTFRRRDADGNPVDWDAAVRLSIDIDPAAPTPVAAVVTGALAAVRIEQTVADQVTNTTTWQAVMSESGSPSTETPLAVGKFQRQDGN